MLTTAQGSQIQNLLPLLQADLRALSQEAKRKYINVKDAADRALVKLNNTPVQELYKTEEVVKPVLYALDSKPYSPKLLLIAVPCLQKLLSHNAVPYGLIPRIIELLTSLTESYLLTGSNPAASSQLLLVPATQIVHHNSQQEDLAVKVLQALTTLVSCNPTLHGTPAAQVLGLLFKIHARGSLPVRATASATLPMTITMLFDRAERELEAIKATTPPSGEEGQVKKEGSSANLPAVVAPSSVTSASSSVASLPAVAAAAAGANSIVVQTPRASTTDETTTSTSTAAVEERKVEEEESKQQQEEEETAKKEEVAEEEPMKPTKKMESLDDEDVEEVKEEEVPKKEDNTEEEGKDEEEKEPEEEEKEKDEEEEKKIEPKEAEEEKKEEQSEEKPKEEEKVEEEEVEQSQEKKEETESPTTVETEAPKQEETKQQEETKPAAAVAAATAITVEEPVKLKKRTVEEDLGPATRDAYLLMGDLCSLTSGEPAVFVVIPSLAPTFGMELIELIISSHSQLFRTALPFRALLSDRICPLLIKAFHRVDEFPICVRLARLVSAFVMRYANEAQAEVEVLMLRLMKLLDPDAAQNWQQVLALEVFRPVLVDVSLTSLMFTNYDMRGSRSSFLPEAERQKGGAGYKVFENSTLAVGKIMQSMFSTPWKNFPLQEATPASRSRVIEHLSQAEPPHVTDEYRMALALACLLGVTNCINELTRGEKYPKQYLQTMASSCWTSILGGLSMVLRKSDNESVVQTILKAFEYMVFVLGTLELEAPRDAFLTYLCKFTTPVKDVVPKDKSGSSDRNNSALTSSTEDIGGTGGATMKSIEAVRTLMNVVHCLGAILGNGGWHITLQAVEDVNRAITSFGTPGTSASAPSQVGTIESDISVAASALMSFLASSVQLDGASAKTMFTQLVKLSAKTVSNAEDGMPDFYLQRVMEAAQINVARLDILWDTLRDHVLLVTKRKSATIRTFVLTQLLELIVSILCPSQSNTAAGSSSSSSAEKSKEMVLPEALVSPKEKLMELQVPFIHLLEEVLSTTTFPDTRLRVLSAVHRIIQTSGTIIVSAWPPALSLLMASTRLGDKQATPAAFQTVQLICTDLLPSLPCGEQTGDCLSQYVSTVSLYARQTDHVNISLTSGELLWSVAYYVAKLLAAGTTASDQSSSATATVAENPVRVRSMWVQVFTELKDLAVDERFDVRSGATSILFRALSTHAPLFDVATWDDCLWNILFPMLEAVKQQAMSTMTLDVPKEAKTAPQKQWTQSVVMEIEGAARLFKSTTEMIGLLPRFDEAWIRLVQYIEDCASDLTSHEVGECSLTSDLMLLGRAAELRLNRELWTKCLTALEKICSVVISRDPHRTTPQVLTATATSLAEMVKQNNIYITPGDLLAFIDVAKPLAMLSIDDFVDESGLNSLQKGTFKLLETIIGCGACTSDVIEHAIAAYASFPQRAAATLRKRPSTTTTTTTATTAEQNARMEERRSSTVIVVGCSGCTLCSSLYCGSMATRDVRLRCLHSTMASLSEALQARYKAPNHPSSVVLWKAALTAFATIAPLACEACVSSSVDPAATQQLCVDGWTDILDTATEFLFPSAAAAAVEPSSTSGTTTSSSAEADQLDVTVIDNLVANVITYAPIITDPSHVITAKLLTILSEGSKMTSRGRERLCRASYHGLFKLASIDSNRPDLVAIFAPVVVTRSTEVISQFVADDRNSGNLPVHRTKLIEMLCVLREAKDLRTCLAAATPSKAGSSDRPHLLTIYPFLCECVTTPEMEIKSELKLLLELIGQEFLGGGK